MLQGNLVQLRKRGGGQPRAAPTPARAALATLSAAEEKLEKLIDKKDTPLKLGYTMPGEFEPHTACWIGWPGGADEKYLWREGGKPAEAQYVDVATTISQFEPVQMLANPGQPADEARAALQHAKNVSVVEVPLNDGWARDWGPSCVARANPQTGKREVAGVHWDFDSYGGNRKRAEGFAAQVPDWTKDNAAGRLICERVGIPVFEVPGFRLEGGSIHTDGQGTLICTEQCLLHWSRNPDLGREGIEKVLKEYLGLQKIIWLWKGMAGDDAITNGHVDNIATFIRPGVVAVHWSEDENDPQYEISAAAYETLSSTPDAQGRKLEVHKVPCPPPLFRTHKEADGVAFDHVQKGYNPRVAGERLPASYINHYIANGGAVVPAYGGKATDTDQAAREALAKAHGPDRKVVSVRNSREVLLNAGNVHCITQQYPKAG